MRHKAAFALLGVIAALAGCGNARQAPPAEAVRPVLVRPVAAGQATPVTYSGEVRARYESDLAFRVPGKLIARLADVGARVERGQALAKLDPADLRLNADAARAQLAAAESDYALAEAEQGRYSALLEKKLIARSLYDAKVTAYRAAKARRDQVRAQMTVIGNQENYSTLSADQAGVVTGVLAEVGQVVAAGQPVVRVARSAEKEIAIHIPEGQVADARAAKAMWVTLWARPELRLPAELRELSPTADAATRTYGARVRLLATDPVVQLGMTAQVALQTPTSDAELVVPLTAVVDRGNGPAVWVVVDDKAQRRPVEIRRYREDGAVLAGGVRAGEQVVTVGAHKLVADQRVRPVVQDAATAATAR
ncbi:MAG: efflux RND transporter periplasmic adaptor subunit [Candidatus Competibacteraceae bacterium]|nr:efflux RND transporter periplasmic adaptor subunit [Candidatus Competibacteraceae bacterium]